MMSDMTDWDENDITRWPEDDDPESLAGADVDDENDSRLKAAGILWLPGPSGERVEVNHG